MDFSKVVSVETTSYIVPDLSSAIDKILERDLVKAVYKHWDAKKHGQPIDYGGGVQAITGFMLLTVGRDFLMELPGIGEKKSSEILDALKKVVREEIPYV